MPFGFGFFVSPLPWVVAGVVILVATVLSWVT